MFLIVVTGKGEIKTVRLYLHRGNPSVRLWGIHPIGLRNKLTITKGFSGRDSIPRDATKKSVVFTTTHCESLRNMKFRWGAKLDHFAQERLCFEVVVHSIPVNDVPPCRDVIGATILVVEIVSVLPYVEP